ncbi:MAG: hypothetical protein GF421_04950, partial [Candidatus Aminicenantes bacterium]|nr:hypothetical protein [Candidatus Aminicenantes bacterium]
MLIKTTKINRENSIMKKLFFLTTSFFVFFIVFSFGSDAKYKNIPERGFISSEQAKTWEQGLICGNGTIGANVLSRPLDETIIFSHERLFLPKGPPLMPPDNAARLFEIRRLIDRGLYKQSAELAFDLSGQDGFMYPDPFVPAFDLNIQTEKEGQIKDYMRSVNFQTGEASVQWEDQGGKFGRRIFVSRADGIAVLLITGPKKGSLHCRLNLKPRNPSHHLDARQIQSSYRVFSSHVSDIKTRADKNNLTFRNRFSRAYPGSIHALEGVAHVIADNGTVTSERDTLRVTGAHKLLVLIDIEMIYDPENSKTEDMIQHISSLPADYNTLLKRHTD